MDAFRSFYCRDASLFRYRAIRLDQIQLNTIFTALKYLRCFRRHPPHKCHRDIVCITCQCIDVQGGRHFLSWRSAFHFGRARGATPQIIKA